MTASRKHIARVFGAALAILLSGDSGFAQTRPPGFIPRDESPEEFPAGPGRDEAFFACTACHGFKLIAQQGMGRRQWEESIERMTTRHNMPPLKAKERKAIVEYLASIFPARTTGQGNWKNPFAK